MPDASASPSSALADVGLAVYQFAGADELRAQYLSALADAALRPARGDAGDAVQRFLMLNAAYFLGEWLPACVHARLVRRMADDLDGLADVAIPADPAAAAQLAQHARELAAAFGASPWTDRVAAMTEPLVPWQAEDWDAVIHEAAGVIAGDPDTPSAEAEDQLLLAHARRRMWQLAHPLDAGTISDVPDWALRFAMRAAEAGDGRAIQVAEALLAELTYGAVQL